MSTNEELAKFIQNGHTELLPQLWEQMHDIIRTIATCYMRIYGFKLTACGISRDDIYQEGYFALIKAVKAYKPDTGFKLTTYLNYHMKNCIRFLIGKKNDAVLRSDSLDKPITGDKDLTLGGVISDPDSEAEIIGIIENEYQRQLHAALDVFLNRLDPTVKEAIVGHFYNNVSFQEMAEKNETTPQVELNLFNKGLRKLRQSKTLQTLKTYL
jgi:RNA polymerase sporulation-specific sigma factor